MGWPTLRFWFPSRNGARPVGSPCPCKGRVAGTPPGFWLDTPSRCLTSVCAGRRGSCCFRLIGATSDVPASGRPCFGHAFPPVPSGSGDGYAALIEDVPGMIRRLLRRALPQESALRPTGDPRSPEAGVCDRLRRVYGWPGINAPPIRGAGKPGWRGSGRRLGFPRGAVGRGRGPRRSRCPSPRSR